MTSKILGGDEEENMKLFCCNKDDLTVTEQKIKDDPEGGKGVSSSNQDVNRFGCYQVVMFVIISMPLLLSAGSTLAYVFTAGAVKYRCLVPECENPSDAVFDEPWLVDSAPHFLSGSTTSCIRYVVRNHTGECMKDSFTNVSRSCDSWVYEPSENTILSEWDITCDANRWKLTLVGTVNNVGQFFGLIFAGYVSDRYGRRTILTLAMVFGGISGLIHSFSVNYWMFIVFEFLDSTSTTSLYSASFILALEMVGMKNRILGSTITCCVFAIGEVLLGALAMWLKSWRVLLRVIYGPALLGVLLPVLIPESVRWLVSNGKHKEVDDIYYKIVRMNRLEATEESLASFKELNVTKSEKSDNLAQSEGKGPIRQVLNSSVILIRLLACSFCWLTNTFVYYGLSLNSVAFAGDKYINFMLVASVEIPAYFLTWVLTDCVGRKPTLCASFLLSGAFCLAIHFIPADTCSYLPLILYMGGKWCITMAFATVYVYTAELFPTSLRHSLLGICSMTGRVGSVLSPQTPLLAQIIPGLPLILFGCMGLSAGFLSLIFPETLGIKLPDTIWEAENIGKVQVKQGRKDSVS